jgi:crossover junction endodeoxyribonuclease RusA
MVRLPMPPSNNTYKRHYCVRSSSRDVHQIKARLTKGAERFKHDAGWLAKEAGIRVHAGPVRVEITAYQSGDKDLDLDNIPKVLFDALNGVAWEDDRQVKEYTVRARRLPRGKPYIEVEIFPLAIILGEETKEDEATAKGKRLPKNSGDGTGLSGGARHGRSAVAGKSAKPATAHSAGTGKRGKAR